MKGHRLFIMAVVILISLVAGWVYHAEAGMFYDAQTAADSWGEQLCEDSGGLAVANVERGESEMGDLFEVSVDCNDGTYYGGLEFICYICEI